MLADRTGTLAVLALLLAAVSCTRLPERETAGRRGPLPAETMPDSISVPAVWGNLVTVSPDPTYALGQQLWFQAAQGNIRSVGFDRRARRLSSTAFLITRR